MVCEIKCRCSDTDVGYGQYKKIHETVFFFLVSCYRFDLYLNLGELMGSPILLSCFPYVWPEVDILPFVAVASPIAPLQAIFVFNLVKEHNGRLKRLIRKLFQKIMCSLGYHRLQLIEVVIKTKK